MIKPLEWIRAIVETCDNSDGYIKLYRKGVEFGCIQPQTKAYWDLKDIVHDLEWESYPKPSGYDYYEGKEATPYYLLWVDNIAVIFDDFEVYWQ